jgi:hypothetical protein
MYGHQQRGTRGAYGSCVAGRENEAAASGELQQEGARRGAMHMAVPPVAEGSWQQEGARQGAMDMAVPPVAEGSWQQEGALQGAMHMAVPPVAEGSWQPMSQAQSPSNRTMHTEQLVGEVHGPQNTVLTRHVPYLGSQGYAGMHWQNYRAQNMGGRPASGSVERVSVYRASLSMGRGVPGTRPKSCTATLAPLERPARGVLAVHTPAAAWDRRDDRCTSTPGCPQPLAQHAYDWQGGVDQTFNEEPVARGGADRFREDFSDDLAD